MWKSTRGCISDDELTSLHQSRTGTEEDQGRSARRPRPKNSYSDPVIFGSGRVTSGFKGSRDSTLMQVVKRVLQLPSNHVQTKPGSNAVGVKAVQPGPGLGPLCSHIQMFRLFFYQISGSSNTQMSLFSRNSCSASADLQKSRCLTGLEHFKSE